MIFMTAVSLMYRTSTAHTHGQLIWESDPSCVFWWDAYENERQVPLHTLYLQKKQRPFFSFMTKRDSVRLTPISSPWIPDSDLVKLNTNHPDGETKEEGLFQSALKDIFTTAERKHPPHCQRHGQWRLTTSRWLWSLIWVLQTKHVCAE